MNYWDMQKSFWKTPKGIAIWFFLLLAVFAGSILALNIYISPYPVIEYLDVNPVAIDNGESSNLSWNVIGASLVEIDPGVGRVELKGSRLLSPSKTTTYTLTAVNGTKNRTTSVRVLVH